MVELIIKNIKGNDNKMVRLLLVFILMLSGITTNAQYRTPYRFTWQRNMTNQENYRNNSVRDMYKQDVQRRRMTETQNKSEERYRNSYERKNNTEVISKREEPKVEVVAPPKKADDITLVVSGEGKTKDEATKQALRSAIEQAFGTFVSAHTEVLNDELIQDEIVSISTGNITGYKEIDCIESPNGNKNVTLEATVSIGQLTNFAKSKGMSVELETGAFAMNMKIRELNKKNEVQAIKDLQNKMLAMTKDYNLYDYNLVVGEPYLKGNDYAVSMTIEVTPNINLANFRNTIVSTLKALSLTETEIAEYSQANIPVKTINIRDYSSDEDFLTTIQKGSPSIYKKVTIALRNTDEYYPLGIFPFMMLDNELRFAIKDNLGRVYNNFVDLKPTHYNLIANTNLPLWQFKDYDDKYRGTTKGYIFNYSFEGPIKIQYKWASFYTLDDDFDCVIYDTFLGSSTYGSRLGTAKFVAELIFPKEEFTKLEKLDLIFKDPILKKNN